MNPTLNKLLNDKTFENPWEVAYMLSKDVTRLVTIDGEMETLELHKMFEENAIWSASLNLDYTEADRKQQKKKLEAIRKKIRKSEQFISKKQFTPEEDKLLLEHYDRIGPKWGKIAKMTNKGLHDVKNRAAKLRQDYIDYELNK